MFVMHCVEDCNGYFNVMVVVKLIRMAPHTRLQNIQFPPTMDGIVLVMVDGLRHGATNEPIASMLENQVGSWKKNAPIQTL